MDYISTAFIFIKDNLLLFLIPLLVILLFLLKPFRALLKYMGKNTVSTAFYLFLSILCSSFGYTLAVNVYTILATVLLGLPGISLVLFMSLIIH